MASSTTRKQIRRRAGRLTGDMLLLTATGAGTTTTFVDTLNANKSSSILVNRQGYVSGGTVANLGSTVRISDNEMSTQTLTFTPAVASATAEDDELELWNERDEGVTPGEVNALIDEAILDIQEFSLAPVTSDSLTFDAEDPVIDIDALEVSEVADGLNWEAITGIDRREYEESPLWIPIERADLRVDRYARTIEIMNRNRWLADDTLIRVRGANYATVLTSDSQTTTVNFEWITCHVAAQILGLRLERVYDRKEVEGNMLRLQARADSLRPRTVQRLRGAFWRLS